MKPFVRDARAYGRRPIPIGAPEQDAMGRALQCPQCSGSVPYQPSLNSAKCPGCGHRWFWRLTDLIAGQRKEA